MARVAAVQFASGTDLDSNLETCLRMIDQAACIEPDIMVLPEFCNHISWYDDAEHAWEVAVPRDGEFLRAIGARAARHQSYIVINVSLRGVDRITVSSLLFGPEGQLVSVADKQTLMGHENTWFARADTTSDVVATPFGRIAMFPCRDGVTFETPRGLALRGAQLFCDSLNSFALDEASLHVPTRAPENKVFLVSANKVGPLIPEALLEPVSAETHIPVELLYGAGESQIIAPDGRVLARAPRGEEAVIHADIDLAAADDKTRPDGSDLFGLRRPQLYGVIAQESVGPVAGPAAAELPVATLLPPEPGEGALAWLPAAVASLPPATSLAVLPGLFCYPKVTGYDEQHAIALGQRALAAMSAACKDRPGLLLCTSLVLPVGAGSSIAAVLVGENGLRAQQQQLHASAAYAAHKPGDELHMVDLPWGRLAMLAGDDAVVPEVAKMAALAGAHVLAIPFQLQEAWERDFGLPSRAAENRVCIVASSWPQDGRAGLIATLEREFTIMTPWRERQFDGRINEPVITSQDPDVAIVTGTVHPAAACNKLMSEATDLLLDRPWRLSEDLLRMDLPGELA
jgi:predicted amidohydrolase